MRGFLLLCWAILVTAMLTIQTLEIKNLRHRVRALEIQYFQQPNPVMEIRRTAV